MKKELKMTPSEFEKIYRGNTSVVAAKILKISIPTMVSYAKEFGIELKKAGAKKGVRKIKFIF